MSQVKPYSPEGSKKEQVAEMFNAISPKYDALNRILSVGIDQIWRRKTVREIRTTGATQILDVATGTADLALALADGIPGSHVVGVDISAGMLDVGRQKVRARRKDDRVRLDLGDGEHRSGEAKSNKPRAHGARTAQGADYFVATYKLAIPSVSGRMRTEVNPASRSLRAKASP